MLSDIKKLQEHFQGDEELIGELIEIFAITYPEVITRLEQYVEKSDIENCKLEAHTLKGMISNFFAEDLRLVAFDIESNSSKLSKEELNHHVLILKEKIPQMIKEIKDAKL